MTRSEVMKILAFIACSSLYLAHELLDACIISVDISALHNKRVVQKIILLSESFFFFGYALEKS